MSDVAAWAQTVRGGFRHMTDHHHHLCNTAKGGECDCYYKRQEQSEAALALLERAATNGEEAAAEAQEAIAWLDDNERGMFNICCQRCNAPFAHGREPVAAPAEWFGLLEDHRKLARALLVSAGGGKQETGGEAVVTFPPGSTVLPGPLGVKGNVRIEGSPASPVSAGQGKRGNMSAVMSGEICRDCNKPVVTHSGSFWSAPDELWNEVWGDEGGILCQPCFVKRADAMGIHVRWEAIEYHRSSAVSS